MLSFPSCIHSNLTRVSFHFLFPGEGEVVKGRKQFWNGITHSHTLFASFLSPAHGFAWDSSRKLFIVCLKPMLKYCLLLFKNMVLANCIPSRSHSGWKNITSLVDAREIRFIYVMVCRKSKWIHFPSRRSAGKPIHRPRNNKPFSSAAKKLMSI